MGLLILVCMVYKAITCRKINTKSGIEPLINSFYLKKFLYNPNLKSQNS